MKMTFLTKYFRAVLVGILLMLSGVLLGACQPTKVDEHPVFSIVRSNNTNRLGQYLAEAGDPNLMNGEGDTLLYVASGAKGGPEVVRQLLLAGADPDLLSREGRTALHTAAGWCNTASVELLLDSNARVDIKNAEGKLAIEVVCSQPKSRREPVLALLQAAAAR